jgi:sugar diacid utilization regulator
MTDVDIPADAPPVEVSALRARLEQAQLRERSLVAVLESARDLVAMRDLEQVLQGIVARARQLVGAQLAFLASYDPEHAHFYVRATDGAVSVRLPTLTLARGYGMISLIADSGVPRQSSHYAQDDRFAHNPEVDAIFSEEGIDSLLGVPLPFGTEVVGILYVGDRYSRTYLGWEISMLSTLAAHAAVAMHNARAFEEARDALRQAGEANALLAKQAAGIRLAADAHLELTALVAKGGGPEDIARVLASMLKGAVLVADEGGRVIAAAAAPPAAEAGPAPEPTVADPNVAFARSREPIRAAVRESRAVGRSLEVASPVPGSCRVAAVVGGSGILGGMVIWTQAPIDEFAIRIFERSATITGVVLLSQERLALAASRDRMAILRGLLHWHQDDLAGLTARAARHGVDLRGPVVLAAVEVDGNRASYVLRKLREAPGLEAMLLDEIDGLLVVLSGGSTPGPVRETLGRRLGEFGRQVTGVVSEAAPRVAELPRVYESLRRCLGLLRRLERTGTIASEAELRPFALAFERLGREEIGAFFEATIGKLLEADRNRGAALAATLLAYLDHEHNARHTAAALGIHVNTLRQRFSQIDDLLGDWRSGTRALDIHLALRLWQLRGGSAR